MKALVTGADGFIGSHLVEILVRNGYNVRAFSYYNSFNSWGWLDSLPKDVMTNVEVFQGDVRDGYCVNKAMSNMEQVFHLAALIGIPYSYRSPESYIETNIKGALNILESAKEHDVSRVLMTSTSEVYGTAEYIPIDERHPLKGQSPYSASKIASDKLAESYYRSFDLPITIVRPFNTYGPRQSARAIIPTIITQLLEGSTMIKLGDLSPTRDFNYVKDTANGFYHIANSVGTIGEEINIATKNEISMGLLANLLIEMINPKARIVIDETRLRPSKSEVNQLLGDNQKILSMTSWKSEYTFEQGIEETIEWFRDNYKSFKADIYNV